MVASKLDDEINYKTNREIAETDKHFMTVIYETSILDVDILISLGRENTDYASKNIYFFYVYLVSIDEKKGDRVKSRIGIIEYKSAIQDPDKRLKTISDSDGDIDFEKMNPPILYSFVAKGFLESAVSPKKTEQEQKDADLDVVDIEKQDLGLENPHTNDEEDDVFDLPKYLSKKGEDADDTKRSTAPRLSKDKIFEIQTRFQSPELLPEESLEMAKELKAEFRDSATTTWIEKFMKNNEYAIVETATNGDCFFDTVVKAFEQIGKKTTVAKLRAILAEETTQEFYDNNRTLYLDAVAEQDSINTNKLKLKQDFHACKILITKASNKAASDKIVNGECKILKAKYDDLKKDQRINQNFLREFAFMEHANSLDKLKAVIQTTEFWANTWAISTLERRLNAKIVVMSKEAFDANDDNSVLLCGQLNDTVLEKQGYFRPDHYIITEYSGNHYRLISYKQKRIFEFSEIPFYLKTLIFNKCLERNAGPYYLIDDIRNFNTKMGADTGDTIHEEERDEMDKTNNHLYDKSAVFMYYSNSNGKPAPGKGNGEKVQDRYIMEFKDLQKVKDWRRMLDDDWVAPFKLDDQTWETVEHYYQAAKFKNKNRDFYLQFTSNSGSPFAKDPTLANAAGSKLGTYKDKTTKTTAVFRDKSKIQIDPDFYGTRHLEERRKAVYAKFSQTPELQQLLRNTKHARLTMYVPKKPAVDDTELMIVRNDIVK